MLVASIFAFALLFGSMLGQGCNTRWGVRDTDSLIEKLKVDFRGWGELAFV